MATTTYWSPNQELVAQVETYTFSAPNSPGNWYIATINSKSVTYVSVSGDTATTVATAMTTKLNASAAGFPELAEITFANPSAGVMTATASVPGTPFANVPGTSAGLVMSTGNGLANGIATVHTTANASPSDVNDPQNWLRVTIPAPGVKALPQNGDNVVARDSIIPMLWNLDQLAAVQFNTYTRWQSMTGQIGLPYVNPNGYNEWRATYFKFIGPAGSVPAGGLQLVVGQGDGTGPPLEQYNVGPQQTTLTVDAGTLVRFLGVHANNTFTVLGGVDLEVATQIGEIATLNSCTGDGNATIGIGVGVTWTGGSALSMFSGSVSLNAAPSVLNLYNGSNATVVTDQLTWTSIVMQGGSNMRWLAGGTITSLALSNGCTLDKSVDARALTITNTIIDGDTCRIVDPLNSITFTNAATVKQNVTSGPFQFTGPRTVKVV